MSKLNDELQNQLNNPNSLLQNILNGKPATTIEAGMDNKTILKLVGGILFLGIILMVIYKKFIQ